MAEDSETLVDFNGREPFGPSLYKTKTGGIASTRPKKEKICQRLLTHPLISELKRSISESLNHSIQHSAKPINMAAQSVESGSRTRIRYMYDYHNGQLCVKGILSLSAGRYHTDLFRYNFSFELLSLCKNWSSESEKSLGPRSQTLNFLC